MSTEFTSPGPGQWQLDRSHFPGGATPIIQTLIPVAVESAYRKQWPIFGIPAVVGAADAMEAISDGDRIEVDPVNARVRILTTA